MITFNPSLFFQYATCPHWVWRDRFGDQRRKGEVPELAQKLLEQGVLHEEEYIKNFDLHEEPLAKVEGDFGEAAYQQTMRLMRQGAPWIYQGVIYADFNEIRYQGRPDLLERIPIPSQLGNYAYRPIDIKNSKEIKQNHWLQLTLYGLILEKIQGVFPEDVAIINSERQRLDYQLTMAQRHKTNAKIQEILRVINGTKPPLKLVGSCKQSPWFGECVREAEEANDLALIYKIDNRALTGLRRIGISTIKQLAAATSAAIPKLPYLSNTTLERIHLQAKALVDQKLIWLKLPQIASAPIKIYFDMEGDPLLQIQYLFGWWIVGDETHKYSNFGKIHTNNDRAGYYLYFVAERPEDEADVWQQVLQWLTQLPLSDCTIYHYADYERSRLLSLAERYGGLDKLSPVMERLVDLAKVVQECVIMPLYFYSIKDIAKSKFLNYHWRHPKAGGAQSIFWYEKWLETGDQQVLNDIIDYNEDDVVATEYLHRWLLTAAKLKLDKR